MTDNSIRAGSLLRYVAPQLKTINVKARQVLCQSPGLEGWNEDGSHSDVNME